MLGPGIRSSSTMSFELERSVPWGRDLFTFVTSAAGHMMRTLQRPRKNKPSKRQVNHRRFLHNMIQRKFAEIEAGNNHQLASALCSSDTTHSQLGTKSSPKTEHANTMKNATADSSKTGTSAKQQNVINSTKTSDSLVDNPNANRSESKSPKNGNNSLNSEKDNVIGNKGEELGNSQDNSPQESTAFNCEKELFQSTPVDLDNLLQVSNIILEDSIDTWLENIEKIQQNSNVHIPKSLDEEQDNHPFGMSLLDYSPALPAVSPLTLDSREFDVQLQTDIDHISEMQYITESLQIDGMENAELLESTEGSLQSHHNDQRNIASAWHMQSEEDQSCFQNNFTFLNTSHVGCVMDIQTDCSEELEDVPQFTMLLQNSIKDLNTEQDLSSNVGNPVNCGSSCHQNKSVYMARQTDMAIDSYLKNPAIHTAKNKESQYTVSGIWSTMEEISKGLKQDNFSNHILDNQVLHSTEHAHTNNALSQYWEQHPIHEIHALGHIPLSGPTDPYCMLLDENSSIDSGTTLNPNSIYTSPPNLHSSSKEHFYSFSMPPQAKSSCEENSCLYSNGEGCQGIPSFEGVAQSFPVPAHKPHPHPVSTPPLNDDWLFSNIVAEENFKSMIKSPGHTYC